MKYEINDLISWEVFKDKPPSQGIIRAIYGSGETVYLEVEFLDDEENGTRSLWASDPRISLITRAAPMPVDEDDYEDFMIIGNMETNVYFIYIDGKWKPLDK